MRKKIQNKKEKQGRKNQIYNKQIKVYKIKREIENRKKNKWERKDKERKQEEK